MWIWSQPIRNYGLGFFWCGHIWLTSGGDDFANGGNELASGGNDLVSGGYNLVSGGNDLASSGNKLVRDGYDWKHKHLLTCDNHLVSW